MRPDEHKKKKNTAYKKKHGISGKASTSADNAAAEKKSKPKEQKTKSNIGGSDLTSTNRNPQKASRLHDSSDSSGNDSETETVAIKKSYRRRELVSNWNKYELEPDSDEKVTSRGEDFTKLLNMAGETMSHFRFQEELEWEDDASSGDGAQHDPVASRFLNLDLADLSSSMSCIPLHKLLGIDQSLFPADQLESHMKSVGERRCVYFDSKNDKNDNLLPKRGKEESKTRTGENSKELCESFSNDVNIASSTCSHESNHIESGLKKHKADEATASSNNLSAQELKIQQASLAHVDAAKQSHSETSLGLEDDELDQLLDMDVRQEDKTDKTESSSDLNSISNGKAAPPSAKKDEKDQADELEDWLDSILD